MKKKFTINSTLHAVFFLMELATQLRILNALNCHTDRFTNSFNFFLYNTDTSKDTSKITVTYQLDAFRAFPITKLECINLSDDTDKSNDLSCQQCLGNTLSHGLLNSDGYLTCKLTSKDGLSTTWCSQSTANVPYVVTSCYQGIFSAETPLAPSQCKPISTDNQGYKPTQSTNALFCVTKWVKSIDGEVSALGRCSSSAKSASYSLSPGIIYQTCNQDNCNNVLICYVGNYFQITNDGSTNTIKPSLCHATENSVCKMEVSWTSNNGYALVGSCQRQAKCNAVKAALTDDENTKGTLCCTNQYCNDPFSYAFYNENSYTSRSYKLSASYLVLFIIGFVL